MKANDVTAELPEYKEDEKGNDITKHGNYEVKCRRVDADYTYIVEGVSYDHDNEVIWLDIRRD
jgi:hypothetical protein